MLGGTIIEVIEDEDSPEGEPDKDTLVEEV
jgi:hypothetical protein